METLNIRKKNTEAKRNQSTSVRWATRNQAQKLDKLQSRMKIKPYFVITVSFYLIQPII